MKVKNIAFSGFAAAILGGVCGATDANAITLVSPEYVTKQLESKQDVLTPGSNINIAEDNTISASFDTTNLATKAEVEAIGSKIPTDYVTENDLSGYATTSQLDAKQNKLTAGSGVTIDESTNTISADTAVVATKASVDELANKIPESGAVSETDVANKIADSLTGYAKSADLATVATTGQYSDLLGLPTLITQDDLTSLQNALQAEIDKKENEGDFATSTQLSNLSTELSNLKGDVYTKAEVDKKITDAVTNGTVDLTGYATVTALNELKDSLKTVATTGSYNDLTDKPTIPTTVAELTDAAAYALKSDLPTKTSQLTNDSNYVTSSTLDGYVTTADLGDVETEIETLAGKIPTKVSELENDSKYISGNGTAGNYIVHLDGTGNVTWKPVVVVGEDGTTDLLESEQ